MREIFWMDMQTLTEFFSPENVYNWMEKYRSFGPLPGILLPMAEAFLPFLPLFLFVAWNANVYGLFVGFLWSWMGAVSGALLVFFTIRSLQHIRIFRWLQKQPKTQHFLQWLEEHGFGPLFLLLCFPFTPSSIINIVAALSKVSIYQFILAVMLGKMVMIFTISFIGHDIRSLVKQPVELIMMTIFIFLLWYIGKKIEQKYAKRLTKKNKNNVE